jgi:TonB family protein
MSNIVLSAFVAVTLFASHLEAQSTDDHAYLDFQVERAVRARQTSQPVYPERLRAAKIDGEVLVQFVVDEKGVAQMQTVKILKSTDPLFTEAVRKSVAASSFHPAELDGKKVKQVVQLPFRFQSR